MKTIFRMFFMLLLLVGWGLAALSVHVVRTPDRIALLPKEELTPFDAYVDTREWTLDDVAHHPGLVAKLVRSNRQALLSHVVDLDTRTDVRTQLIEAVNKGPRARPAGETKRVARKTDPDATAEADSFGVGNIVKLIDWSSFGFAK